ncbi:hybrid sensor histidine kinase/response regulator [Aphanothece hegewaldii CCALA 016]|uniref:Circadian input-output histidine kinase CikA n=1 Tax=Aphanothece hegewaldii CCALA 016 TaxID=2107694 RepID=A0A2T1LZL9_9CHRO|nr:ATP-binding protein [Aphanothece hegewaldii]PSF37869.1 hybrid sensor histidine kinase/response regulator [Aphanothece hegewaldii CCALA 016]
MSDELETPPTDIESLKAELKNLRQIQEELKESKERFSIILKANNDGIWDWNLKSNKIFYSPRWKEMLGYTEEDLPNHHETWVNLLHEDDRNYAVEFLQAYLERKVASYRLEFRLRCKNGGYQWILSRGKAIWDENGNPVRFAGSHTDISERKHRESMLKNLATREHILSEIARQLLDQDFEIVIQSILQKIGEFTGSEQTYIIRYADNQQEWSMFYEWCNPKNPQLKSRLEQYQNQTVNTFPWFAEQLLNSQPIKINNIADIPDSAIQEKELISNSLNPNWLIVPMTTSKKIVGYLGLEASIARYWTTEDVNWLKLVGEFIAIAQARSEAEKALKIAKEKADTANQAKSEFLANMSHELRTPLNAILGFTQVLNRDNSLNKEQQENLNIINRSGEHLLILINDILEMSKIEAGRITYYPQNIDLHILLETVQDMFSLKAKAKHLKLIFYSAFVPQYIYTDEGKLRQVIINLLSNAIKFTNKGSVTLRVKIAEYLENKSKIRLVFEVEDTGIGIDPSEKDKLFEAFGQTKTGLNSQQGTGLGLSISKNFVQLMGGKIQVKSSLGKGSLFIFDIIAEIAHQKELKKCEIKRQVIGLASEQQFYRILVIDNHLESRILLVKLLTYVGFLVKETNQKKEAIALCKNWKPHLILIDLENEAIQEIKKLDHEQKIIIIALTASAFKEEFNQIKLTYNDFIQKPIQEDLLFFKIAQYLKVTYIYDEKSSQKTNHLNTSINYPDIATNQLKLMPKEWRQQLKKATQECSDDTILELVKKIPLEYSDLAKIIQELTHDFLFDSILNLFDED